MTAQEPEAGVAYPGWIDPFEPGPRMPYWRTEYRLRNDPKGPKYEFGSHGDTMADHLADFVLEGPSDAVRITTYMVITRNGHPIS